MNGSNFNSLFSAVQFATGPFANISNSLDALTSELTSLALKLGVPALIACALWYIAATDAQSARQAKSWGIRIIIGLFVIGMASVIVNWAMNLGTVTTG